VEAASSTRPSARSLTGDKAQRIVDAMRASVARRGVAGSTFDHVAREAGVSRGLLHYYFGTKERLLAEVVRRDCDVRMAMLDEQVGEASTAEDVLARLVANLDDLVERDAEVLSLAFELFNLSRRNPEIATEFAELTRRLRERLSHLLAAKQEEGVLELGAEPDAVADVLLAFADGLALRMLAEPGRDQTAMLSASVRLVRPLLGLPT
jgi:AcrR family transcriptional regulator